MAVPVEQSAEILSAVFEAGGLTRQTRLPQLSVSHTAVQMPAQQAAH
jgi:hypothetical protein